MIFYGWVNFSVDEWNSNVSCPQDEWLKTLNEIPSTDQEISFKNEFLAHLSTAVVWQLCLRWKVLVQEIFNNNKVCASNLGRGTTPRWVLETFVHIRQHLSLVDAVLRRHHFSKSYVQTSSVCALPTVDTYWCTVGRVRVWQVLLLNAVWTYFVTIWSGKLRRGP